MEQQANKPAATATKTDATVGNPAAVINVVQITDCHLGRQQGTPLMGMDTDASLDHVLALIGREQLAIDLLLATGDLSNGGAVNAFERLEQKTQAMSEHRLWLPGNHDDPAAMAEALGRPLQRSLTQGNWLILMLNSTAKGQVGGSFSDDELAFLRDNLQRNEGRHVVICLHHQPVAIGCDWLDKQQVSNSAALFAIIDGFPEVQAVLWGHIHQQYDSERRGVRLMAAPSTCIQFAANSPEFKLDRQNPGYRHLQLHADGRIESKVSRVSGVTFQVDYDNSNGY